MTLTSQVVPDLLEGDHLEQLVDGRIARPELCLAIGVEVWLMTMASQLVPDLLEGDHLKQFVDWYVAHQNSTWLMR